MAKAKRPPEDAWDEHTLRSESPVLPAEEKREAAAIEMEIHVPRPKSDKTWAEVWTQNRIYLLDHERCCFAVRERSSGKRTSTHKLVGFTLLGGRSKLPNGKWRVVMPWPEAGMEAILAQGEHLAVTSATERTVVLVRERHGLSDSEADSLLRALAKGATD